jgi:hypothetical protein
MNIYHLTLSHRKVASVESLINNTTWWHGSGRSNLAEVGLQFGDGMDGKGIYLTREKTRAQMYARRGADGVDRDSYVYQVEVNVKKAWDDRANFLMSDYTDADWAKDLTLDGMNARVYLGLDSNSVLTRRGFDCIHRGTDLILLNKSCVKSVRLISTSNI